MVYKKKDRREGHCNWTDAEVESLKFQADVLHLEWPSIAKVSLLVDDNDPYRR